MWLPFNKIIFSTTIFEGEHGTWVSWCQCFYNRVGFSWLYDAVKKLGFTEIWMVPSWVTSTWAILWEKIVLSVLSKTDPPKSTETILYSSCLVHGFCCSWFWFSSSKINPFQSENQHYTRIQSPGHNTLLMEVMAAPPHLLLFCFHFRKDSDAASHLQQANIASICIHCNSEEFSLPCK